MYTYIEQMWRLSASERAEVKVKHGHTSRFARHTDERAVCYSEAILVYGGLKLISRNNIPYLLANHRGLRVQRAGGGSSPQMNSRGIRAHEFHDAAPATLPEEKRGAWNSRRAK